MLDNKARIIHNEDRSGSICLEYRVALELFNHCTFLPRVRTFWYKDYLFSILGVRRIPKGGVIDIEGAKSEGE